MVNIRSLLLGESRRSRWLLLSIVMFLLAIPSHVLVVANPGFFSHDEWQKYDHVHDRGLDDFVAAYGHVQAGPEFGFPVRPLGFIQQGISSIWMVTKPWIPHLFDVGLHAVVSVVVAYAAFCVFESFALATVMGGLFLLSPLTTMATAWVAATFDQWYTLFVCIACLLTYQVARTGLDVKRALGLILSATCAVLSKETAFVMPGLAVIAVWMAYLRDGKVINGRASLLAIFLLTVPLLAYLAIRFPALANSMAGRSHAAYTPSIANVPLHAVYYFSFPFLPRVSELLGIEYVGLTSILAAVAAHLALVLALAKYAGWRYSLTYIVSYFAFVAPVLSLSNLGSHYAYGSAVPMSAALCTVLWSSYHRKHYLVLALGIVAVSLLTVHMFHIQSRVYEDGLCQSRFLASLDSVRMNQAKAGTSMIVVGADDGASDWVGARAVFARDGYQRTKELPGVKFVSGTFEEAPNDGIVKYVVMTKSCLVREP